MKKELQNPRLYVPKWFLAKGFKLLPNGIIEMATETCTFRSLWLDYLEDFLTYTTKKGGDFDKETGKKYKKIAEKNMEKAFDEFMILELNRVRTESLKFFPYKSNDDYDLKKWLNAVVGTPSDFQINALKHLIWQIKRKMINEKVVYHLCPVFCGTQGGGKSTAIYKLVEPLKHFTLEFSPTEVVDPRNAPTLEKNYVCIFDEMAGMQRLEMEAFKRIITAEYNTYRPLRTNTMIKVKQNTTFIGVSNKSLSENIYDTTGLRRFVEFKCLDVLDWKNLSEVNIIKIWECVDENLPQGYILPVINDLKEHQQSMQVIDELTDYIQSQNLTPIEGQDLKEIPAIDLYNSYILWRNQNGYGVKTAPAINIFFLKIRGKGFVNRTKKIKTKLVNVYTVNANSHIFESSISIVNKLNNVVSLTSKESLS